MLFKLKIIKYWLRFRFRGTFSNRESLERYQKNSFQKFVAKVLVHSPFYNPYIKNIKSFTDVPIIQKKQFMEQFDTINTVGLKLEEAMNVALEAEKTRDFAPVINTLSVGLSTGTSGNRGIFIVSENERAAWTAMVITRVLKPKLFKRQKVAFFLRANNNLYTSINSSLFEFRYFDIFKPLEILAKELEQFNPNSIAAQPSVLMDLCRLSIKGKLSVSPTKIISFAEVLETEHKKLIAEIFNCPITEVYQCTEGFLGVSCKYGVMHLNEDSIHVEKEMIGENRFYPIITDFSRSSQPVVRYRLDDILVEKKEKCKCGSVFIAIEKIVGRADDILIFNTKKGKVQIYPDLICRRIAIETDTFNNYKIIQINIETLHIYLETDLDKKEKSIFEFTKAIEELLGEYGITTAKLLFFDSIEHATGNKFRRVESRILKEK